MELILDEFGSYLKKKDNGLFAVRCKEEFTVACKKIEKIFISTAATITTDAIKLAIENNIDIAFLDRYGEPFARIWYPKTSGAAKIKKKQLECSDTEKGIEYAKAWINDKISRQIKTLKTFSKNKPDTLPAVTQYTDILKNENEKIKKVTGTPQEVRGTIMGYEGNASKAYFNGISLILPQKYRFNGRSRNPGKDFFNTMLNYSYGVLYSLVEKELVLAGLDPFIGFLHAEHHNNKTLVFDMIEAFRFIADETVLSLFTTRKILNSQFDEIEGGYLLNKEGKKLFFEKYHTTLEKSIRYKGKVKKITNIIGWECHLLANSLAGK